MLLKLTATLLWFASGIAAVSNISTAECSPFNITYMWTHEPNGNPAGQVNYYNIAFNISSSNGDTPQTAYCADFWGDNSWFTDQVNYSTNVPVNEWLPCQLYEGSTSGVSEFAFQLFPYFEIGNFSVMVKQNFTQTTKGQSTQIIAQSSPYHISANPADYICNITYGTTKYVQHTHGDCGTPWDFRGYSVPITSVQPACSHATSVQLSFGVQEVTVWGDEVYVIGNITEFGDWDVNRAVHLSAAQYTAQNPIWTGGGAIVEAGTPFEYKYLQWNKDGSWLWECGENRVWTVGEYTCGEEVVSTADWFRCGNH